MVFGCCLSSSHLFLSWHIEIHLIEESREIMKDTCTSSFLGAAPAVLKLFLIIFLLSSYGIVRVQARKLLPQNEESHATQEHQQLKVDRSSRTPTRQTRVSFRRIPPSNSNPTQNNTLTCMDDIRRSHRRRHPADSLIGILTGAKHIKSDGALENKASSTYLTENDGHEHVDPTSIVIQ
ncbi:hypothetical protein BHE74_00015060 [Ensete ventricosum]|nr:hypothetical protein BHE74_00015060 [Ensete ventricosum]